MYQIAQQYGIITEKLYERNSMNVNLNEQPRAGEVISLRKKAKLKPLLHLDSDAFSVEQMQQQEQDEAVEVSSKGVVTTPVSGSVPTKTLPQVKPVVVASQSTPVVEPEHKKVIEHQPTTIEAEQDIWATYPSTNTKEKIDQTVYKSSETQSEQTTGRSIIYDPTPAVNQQPVRVYVPNDGGTNQQPTYNPSPTVISNQPSTTTKPNTKPVVGGTYHTVVKGDTLYGLSRKYNVSVDQIKSWNNLTNSNINVGQRLVVAQ